MEITECMSRAKKEEKICTIDTSFERLRSRQRADPIRDSGASSPGVLPSSLFRASTLGGSLNHSQAPVLPSYVSAGFEGEFCICSRSRPPVNWRTKILNTTVKSSPFQARSASVF